MTLQTALRSMFAVATLLSATAPVLAAGQRLTVVELFQSQGCSSC
jgi:hypothetical protein